MNASKPRKSAAQLTDNNTGVWLVTTASGSVYRFDFDASTVERVGGEPRPSAAPANVLQPLRSIVEVRVGRPGRWWMRNTSGGYLDPAEVWQWSSIVTCIEAEGVCGHAGA